MSWLLNKAKLVYDYPTAQKLYEAVNNEDLARVKDLLRRGVDPNTHLPQTDSGYALFLACTKGNLDIVKALNDAGQRYDGPFQQALHKASYMGERRIVSYLLGKGIPINTRDEFNSTALEIVLQTIAEIEAEDPDGLWPGLPETANYLIGNGADVNAVNNGVSILGLAIRTWDLGIVINCVNHGADVNFVEHGQTMSQIARDYGTAEIKAYIDGLLGVVPLNISTAEHLGNLQVPEHTTNGIQLENIQNDDEVYVLKGKTTSPSHIFLRQRKEGASTFEDWVQGRQQQGYNITVPATGERINSINNVKRYTARVGHQAKKAKTSGGGKRKRKTRKIASKRRVQV